MQLIHLCHGPHALSQSHPGLASGRGSGLELRIGGIQLTLSQDPGLGTGLGTEMLPDLEPLNLTTILSTCTRYFEPSLGPYPLGIY